MSVQMTLFGEVLSREAQMLEIYNHLNKCAETIISGRTADVPAIPYHRILMERWGEHMRCGLNWWPEDSDLPYYCEIDLKTGKLGHVVNGHPPKSSASGSGGYATFECRFRFWRARA